MPEPIVRTYEDLIVAESAEFEITITAEMVDAFAALSGDTNPLHMSDEFAAGTQFGQRIAHGMLGGALFSRLVGMYLPGLHSVYLSQSLFFRQPIFIGTRVHVSGTVSSRVDVAHAVKISMKIVDAATSQILVDGEALVKVLD